MGIHDRPYMQEQRGGGFGGGPMRGMQFALPRPGSAIKWLLIINAAVFFLQLFLDRPTQQHPTGQISAMLGVTVGAAWQIWRYITFQFLHGGVWHIALNMLGLYFLGTPLERLWGPKRFLRFYLTCGVVAGLAYVAIGALSRQVHPAMPIIGASGGVYGVILAAAVLFPHFMIIFLFFPVPIRLAAVVIFGVMILTILQAIGAGRVDAAMSDVAHLGGAVAAAVWIWGVPKMKQQMNASTQRRREGAWKQKMERMKREQQEVDRILQKIKTQGLTSLTDAEKRTLREATERQRGEEKW